MVPATAWGSMTRASQEGASLGAREEQPHFTVPHWFDVCGLYGQSAEEGEIV